MPAGGGGVVGKPVSHRGGAPTQSISEKPEPAVGAPAPGANVSRRRSGRKPGSHRGRCSYTEHIGEARTHCRSTRPGCECQPAAAGLPANPVRTEGGAPTWGMAQVHGVQPGVKAYPMTPPLLTLYTWRL